MRVLDRRAVRLTESDRIVREARDARSDPFRILGLLSAILLAATSAAPAAAQESGPAVRVEGTVLAEAVGNVSGGVRTGTAALYLLRGGAVLDGEALAGARGLSLRVTALATGGAAPADFVGDLQGTSNIAAPERVWPYEAWLQQNIGGRLSLLAGLYDVNSEFDAIDAAGLFLNSSFGIGADYASSGPNGPSIFPATGLAVRIAAAPRPEARVRLVAADGSPGDAAAPDRIDVGWRDGDGVLLAAEAVRLWSPRSDARHPPEGGHRFLGRGHLATPRARVGLGGWLHAGGAAVAGRPGARGAYLLAETRLDGPDARELRLFGRVGLARGPVRAYVGTGATADGPLPGRPTDEAGIGLAVAWPDPSLRMEDAAASAGPEAVLELSYRLNAGDWLFLQPDAQLVANPTYAPDADHALVLVLRAGLLH